MNARQKLGQSRGITLIEVLVSIAIIAMVAATAAPSFIRAIEGAKFNSAARELANALKTARHDARYERRESAVVFDTEDLEYGLGGRSHTLAAPDGTSLMLLTAQSEQIESTSGAIRFFADGSSTGGAVTLTHRNRSTTIEVDWLTGRVRFLN